MYKNRKGAEGLIALYSFMEINKIKLKGKEFPILFDLNVAEAVQKKYGSVEKIAEKIDDLGEIKWILALFINEGIDYLNYYSDQKLKNITERELGFLISLKDLHSGELGNYIIQAFNDSMGEEVEIKNE